MLYIVEVWVQSDTEADWLNWMKSEHVPDVLATECFVGAQIYSISEPGESGYSGYQIHYQPKSAADFQRYQQEQAPALQADHSNRYQGKFKATRRVLDACHD